MKFTCFKRCNFQPAFLIDLFVRKLHVCLHCLWLSFNCYARVCRLLWMLLTWRESRRIWRGFLLLISSLISTEFLRRRFSLRLWRKLVSSSIVHTCVLWHCKCLAWSVIFNVYNFLQMWRTSGRRVHGEGSWLCRREELPSMTLIGSRSCWPKSRSVSISVLLQWMVLLPSMFVLERSKDVSSNSLLYLRKMSNLKTSCMILVLST